MKMINWDKKNVELLKELVSKKLSASEISKIMGGNRNAIIGKCYRLKIKLQFEINKSLNKKAVKPPIIKFRGSLPLPKETIINNRHIEFPPPKDRCCYIVGDPKYLQCCGLDAKRVYCEEHMAACYVSAKKQ